MKNVKIYLRAIASNGKNELMLFDSNRNGAINDLVTTAYAGTTVIWKPDQRSGIKRILRVYSKSMQGNIFRTEPKRRWLCNTFYLNIPRDAKGEEKYGIDFLLCNNTKVTIDPTIIIKHP